MTPPPQKKLTAVVLCITLLLIPRHAKAQSGGIGISGGQAAGIIVAIAAVAAAIGVTVYFVVRHSPSITGCAAANGESLTLLSEADHQTYALSGDIAGIKPGDRVHVSGKKGKDAAGKHTFVVAKMKDYGPCTAAATASPFSGAPDSSSSGIVGSATVP